MNGGAIQGLRARLLSKYNGYLQAHDMIETAITAEELHDCARQVNPTVVGEQFRTTLTRTSTHHCQVAVRVHLGHFMLGENGFV